MATRELGEVDAASPTFAGGDAGAIRYQPALDGIRALAVLAVMAYHGGSRWAHAGFLGVDVFFVLSGFLITLLLLRELRATGRIDRRAFWTRRARRLLPALFVLLLVVTLSASFFSSGSELDRIRGDGLASLFYVQNWRLIVSGQSYFAQFGVPSPLRHMWSLAIEEQWYLIWPLLFLGIVRLARSRLERIMAMVLALAAASAALTIVLYDPGRDPSRVYYGTDTRAQGLLLGAALAVAWTWRPGPRATAGRVALQLAGIVGGGWLLWLGYSSNDVATSLYRGGFTLVALASGALIAAAMRAGPVRTLLRLPPLPSIGRISYGLYLWHWPIFVFMSPARVGVHGTALLLVRFAVTFAVAALSYRLVELPVRERRVPWVRGGLLWVPVGATVVAGGLLVGTSIPALQRTPDREAVDPIALFGKAYEKAHRPPPRGATKVLVVGDSVAFTMTFWGIPEQFARDVWMRGAAIIGCGLARGTVISGGVPHPPSARCEQWPADYEAAVRERDPDVAVLLIGAWEVYDREIDGRRIPFGTPAMEQYLRGELDTARTILTANGAPLVLLSTPCFSPPELGLDEWGMRERREPSRVAWLNRMLVRYAADHPTQVTLLDLHRQICPGGHYADSIDGEKLRTDGVHFTQQGAHLVWRWLAPELRRFAGEHPRINR